MRTIVSFQSTFSEDEIVDQNGLRIEHPGRELAEFLRNAIWLAVDKIGDVQNHDDFAWDIDCMVKRALVWVQVGFLEDKTWLANISFLDLGHVSGKVPGSPNKTTPPCWVCSGP